MSDETMEVPVEVLDNETMEEIIKPLEKFKENLENVNKPEGGMFGEIHIYCGRQTGECTFRAYQESSPAGMLWACLRCRDLKVKLDNNVV